MNNIFEIKNLHLFYNDVEALKGINLDIKEHMITSFIGPSGCGKSTLRVVPVKIENRSVAYNFRLRNYLLSHHHASAASSCPPRCPCSLR